MVIIKWWPIWWMTGRMGRIGASNHHISIYFTDRWVTIWSTNIKHHQPSLPWWFSTKTPQNIPTAPSSRGPEEMRMSIYGKNLNEWDDLARWLKSSDLHGRLGFSLRGRNGHDGKGEMCCVFFFDIKDTSRIFALGDRSDMYIYIYVYKWYCVVKS